MIPSWHLHVDVAAAPRRPIAGTGVAAPVPSPPQVIEQWRRLDAAAADWRRLAPAERVQRIAAASAALRAGGPGGWAEVLARSTGLSSAGLAAAWDVTFAACDAPSLEAAAAAEPEAMVAPGTRLVHVLAGNVLPPTWTMLVRGFLVGAAQWLRPASREPLFAPCVATRLAEHDPALAASFAVLWWPHDDVAVEPVVLGAAQVVTAQGDDASVAAVAARVAAAAPQARFVGYGARWSAALVARGAQTAAVATALARDLALFDGQGCLSPALVLAEDGPRLEAWCALLGDALATMETRLPRGAVTAEGRAALRRWRFAVQLGRALGTHRALVASPRSTAWAVALHARCEWPEPPLDRHVPVLPFSTLGEVRAGLGARLERLQGLAVAWDEWDPGARAAWRDALVPTRVAAAGTLQDAPPGWRQDHRPPLASLVVGELSRS
jgi:hypothetical protein